MGESPKQAAKRLAQPMLDRGFKPDALHEYTDTEGNVIYWRIRAKHPDTGEKWIRPMRLNGKGYELAEPKFAAGKPLYALHRVVNNPDADIWIVEGEQKADALNRLGLVATTSGAAGTAGAADWQPLRARTVRIWPDNDDAGKSYAGRVASFLIHIGCDVSCVDVDRLGLDVGDDVVDWLATRPEAAVSDIRALPLLAPVPDAANALASDEDSDKESHSQASLLVALVESRAKMFHDQNGDVYAQDKTTHETRRIDGRQFRDWLVANFYQTTNKAPRDQSVREALSTLAGLGRFHGECRDVHVRVAAHAGCYFLDLAQPGQSRAVRIEAGRWEIVTDPPVLFVRPETMRPLPEPARGGDLAELWRIANVPEDSRLLVLAWLGECLRPDTPFPVLELLGEQGSAKSTTQTALRRLIDPNACDLRAAPKTVEDMFVSAGANWLASYENISHLSAPMQDALCVLATGGGFAKRKLYSDADESVIIVKRPVVLNGIGAAVTAQDLIDRTLSVETPVIVERLDITVLWHEFSNQHGRLLGALLDAVSGALAHLPQTHLPAAERPRLIEFARFGMALAKALGRKGDEFMAQFKASRQESIARTIDASPVATAVLEWMKQNPAGATDTAGGFMSRMERFKPQRTESWPWSAKGFADALRRAAPALRHMDIECRSLPKTGGAIRWVIKPREISPNQSPARPASPAGGAQDQDIRTFRTSPALFSSAVAARTEIEVQI